MRTASRVIFPLLALSLFGWGCRIAPRIVQAPEAPSVASTPAVTAAYLKLNGGSADVTRNGTTVHAEDNTRLAVGDNVSATRGSVELVYPNAGASRLDAGSSIHLSGFSEIQLFTGSIWTRFEKLFGAGERFAVTANGVVSTVRGTGFGVSIEGATVNVAVAEHRVDVATLSHPERVYHINAGEGVKVSSIAETFVPRKLNQAEEQGAGFVFASQTIPASELQAPANPVELQTTTSSGFAAPTRGVNQNEVAPKGVTPSSAGPTP